MQVGDVAPEFSLPDLSGRVHRLEEYRGRIVLVNFWSCECPHSEASDRSLLSWKADWQGRVVLLPVASNTNESPDLLKAVASSRGIELVLHDRHHEVADVYDAQTTPHVFILDQDGRLRYRGAVDNTSLTVRTPTRHYAHEAVQALLGGRTTVIRETSPFGCSIVRHALE